MSSVGAAINMIFQTANLLSFIVAVSPYLFASDHLDGLGSVYSVLLSRFPVIFR